MDRIYVTILAFIVLVYAAVRCTSSNTPMIPFPSAVCAVETAVSASFGGALANATGASDPVACGTDLLPMLGNLDLCSKPLPAPVPVGPSAMSASAKAWKSVGDISKDDLEKAKSALRIASAAQVMGVVGSIVCPLVDGAAIGYLSANIPKSCQGPNPLSAVAANQILVAACIAAVPI